MIIGETLLNIIAVAGCVVLVAASVLTITNFVALFALIYEIAKELIKDAK